MSELATVDDGPRALDVSYWGGVLVFAAQVADAVSDTEFVPGALRGRREAVAATILYGAEVGLTPMQALAGIHIVDGRPAPSAELARAMILRAGHTFHVVEMTGTRARVWGQRRGRPDSERVVVEWSLDMARSAGLLGRGAWQRYPRAMLVARATGDLARLLFPDVVKGLGYVAEDDPEQLEAWAPEDTGQRGVGSVLLEKGARKPLQRRTRANSAPSVPEVAEVESAPVAPPKPRRPVEDTPELDELTPPSDPPNVDPPYPVGHIPGDVPLPLDDQGGDDELAGVGSVPPRNDDPAPVLPDVEPEQPEDEVEPTPPPLIGVAPLKALQAGITRQLGTSSTREERHALVVAIIGRPIESTKELTRPEGYRVLDYLDRFEDGTARFDYVDQGDLSQGFTVTDTRTPPPDE